MQLNMVMQKQSCVFLKSSILMLMLKTALIWACDCAHLPCVETLIRLSANINTKDTHAGRTAIHWAARAGNLPIVNNYGLTPLYLAKSKGHEGEAVFRYLLGEGAPYNDIKTIDIKKVEAEIARKMAKLAEENGESSE
ncbi:hypothetical protein KC19_9G160900 [Ceratodon purpureus]|uniref:Uncharacterized protein n=1 Tax=Ceratodon purpureus TaxID=3225 RepID=A0A8T0GWE7_CERPU|nr:hypothetical protein KC19_9G160900 [Ceratodon purpureus]